ncbi:MAG TPA: methyl-accepting chemotaxis protein [Bacteroidota bacterium]|nr:methyl-accepting chemotaxis protein [Bacteroidota bacterium]
MQWFNDLKTGKKLLLVFGIMAFVATMIGYMGIMSVRSVAERDDGLYRNQTLALRDLANAQKAYLNMRAERLNVMLKKSFSEKQASSQKVREYGESFEKYLSSYEKTIQISSERKIFDDLQSAYKEYVPLREQFVQLALDGRNEEAMSLTQGSGASILTTLDKSIDGLINAQIEQAQQVADTNQEAAKTATTEILLILFMGGAVAIGMGVFTTRFFVSLTTRIAASLEKMAGGDLTVEVKYHGKDEFGLIANSMIHMTKYLNETISQIAESSATVASASTQISSSTEEMAAGVQEQTSQAGEVASAVEEMTKTIIENSKNASNTADTAREAKHAAEQGGKVVEDTIAGMNTIANVVKKSADTVKELGKSSDQIGEIIGVIDDIADQTNLLALNAAIEAARAGEQGRGFAVVADEVRKLAERTTKATKEIAGMIKKIQSETVGAVNAMEQGTQKVDEGMQLADKAGVSLKEIVNISQRVTDMVNQIAAASEEQSSASEQISKNVEAISAVTNQTATGTQQIAHAAEDLNRLTEDLTQIVTRFKLSETGHPVTKQVSSAARSEKTKSNLAVRANGKLVSHEV